MSKVKLPSSLITLVIQHDTDYLIKIENGALRVAKVIGTLEIATTLPLDSAGCVEQSILQAAVNVLSVGPNSKSNRERLQKWLERWRKSMKR